MGYRDAVERHIREGNLAPAARDMPPVDVVFQLSEYMTGAYGITVSEESARRMLELPRYVILYSDGMTGIATLQAMMPDPIRAGDEGLTADTLAGARETFARIARETMRDIPTNDGGAWADVVPADSWDGITYAVDSTYRLTIGPRGGIAGQWV